MFRKSLFLLSTILIISLFSASALLAATSTDDAITDSIKVKINDEMRPQVLDTANGPDIQVLTRDGKVYLRGNVEDLVQAKQAEDIARSVPGVVDVVNEVNVGPRNDR